MGFFDNLEFNVNSKHVPLLHYIKGQDQEEVTDGENYFVLFVN